MTPTFPSTSLKLGLYPIVDNLKWITRLLNCGVRTLQLRIKNVKNQYIENIVRNAIILGKQYGARLFINDYWSLAIKYHAYGVHLGQEDLDNADLHAISQANLRLGISTHNNHEVERALTICPSYIALGHIFPTQTKEMRSSPQGIIGLKNHLMHLRNISTVAIGGISMSNASEVLDTGVGSIAVVSAITLAPNWYNATQQLIILVKKSQFSSKNRIISNYTE
ncbi:thiamine phosphate synthase [Candidatus Pantoea carbekii]|uniref:Thiamine-phosphate synthase n=1 Tax=Candidatus Pantoea carbekii TaxID=1235990 RepID=U3U8S4_9GAMM|nr:thiamine phosphate synthase [Candidatus Pantoea carbekii]AKC32318.1 thiamine-phosphate pyrophosphorylase [Candidatus Pantoea carbekii]BAO00033.1 thiamine-phosphate pyrophosphorylase [Candidatus Pantoea carbekii]